MKWNDKKYQGGVIVCLHGKILTSRQPSPQEMNERICQLIKLYVNTTA